MDIIHVINNWLCAHIQQACPGASYTPMKAMRGWQSTAPDSSATSRSVLRTSPLHEVLESDALVFHLPCIGIFLLHSACVFVLYFNIYFNTVIRKQKLWERAACGVASSPPTPPPPPPSPSLSSWFGRWWWCDQRMQSGGE